MKLAILTDIHANREALEACLAHAERQGAQRYAFLGDLVGYGADPCACLDIVRQHAERGATVLRGNHDEAALGGLSDDLNFVAREAIVWTRTQLGDAERRFIAELPYSVREEDRLFVHASAERPKAWAYLSGSQAVERCLAATDAGIVVAGHVHESALYFSARAAVSFFAPTPGAAIPLSAGRRWVILPGAVGQPRDGNPAASYAIFDVDSRQLCFYRVAYDWIRAAQKIRAAGLPESLAQRLAHGR